MAGIDLLPGGVGPVPSGKSTRNDTTSDLTPGGSDPGSSSFGSVLSDSMRPTSRKDNAAPSGRDQDSSSSSSRGPNPPSSASQPSAPADKSGSRTDPRRSSAKDKSGAEKSDSKAAPTDAKSTTPTDGNSAPTDSASTIENEVAEVQNDDQQASADAASAKTDAQVPQGVAPAQLVAGLLIASTQTPSTSSPSAAGAPPQSGPTPSQAAIANVQKAPAGLAEALEQAAAAGDQNASQPAGKDSQPAPAAIHSTQVDAEEVVPAPVTPTQSPNQPAAKVASGAQAPPVVVPELEVKASKDTRAQVPDSSVEDSKPRASDTGSASQTQSTRPAVQSPPDIATTEPAPVPAVDASAAAKPATDTPATTAVTTIADSSARQKSDKDQKQGDTIQLGLAPDPAPKETGIQADLTAQTKLTDLTDGNPNAAATSSATDQPPPHLKEQDSDPSTDPNGAVTGFATDNTTRRTDGTQQTAPSLSERTVNASQVVDQVSHGIQMTHQSGERMQIHLRPPELGNLQIDVSMRDGMLSARLEAQSPATHQLLVDNLPQLKDSLTQQGLQVDRLEVDLSDLRSDSSAGGFSGQQFEQQQQNENLDGVWDQLPNSPAPQRRTQAGESRVTTARNANGPMLSLDITV